MLATYTYPEFRNARPAEIGQTIHRPVVVVGAGPVGLAMAIDLAQRSIPVLLLDEDHTVSIGSRGLCYAKRTLEILDRLGAARKVCAKGVSWNVGRTFFERDEVYRFDLLAEPDHALPGMVNLQQYYLEEYLLERAARLPSLEIRWDNRVTALEGAEHAPELSVTTPEGDYTVRTDWLLVADGARSPLRRMLGLDIEGRVFQDRFLIADVLMKADFPAERWFWFDPPFHPNQSVLLHREADNVWRIDFQLGWDVDPEAEKKPERVIPRIQAMLGPDHAFELEWVSVYTFQCRRMKSFRHGATFFLGDAAHQVSPFGARGANSGIQDADNLGWKLAATLEGAAGPGLLQSYDLERVAAADENLLNSTRSTDFITPKSPISRLFRDSVLHLARRHPFARALVNSGRLSVPAVLVDSPLNTPDAPGEVFAGRLLPGAPAEDAPVADGWLLAHLGGDFVLMLAQDREDQPEPGHLIAPCLEAKIRVLLITPSGAVPAAAASAAAPAAAAAATAASTFPARTQPAESSAPATARVLCDVRGRIAQRYDLTPGTAYLIRPDQHVAARFRNPTAKGVLAAHRRALGFESAGGPNPEPALERALGPAAPA